MLRRALSFDRKKKSSADDATAAPSNGAETARPRTGSHEPVIVSMRRSLSFGRRESLPTNWRRARDDQNEVYYYHVLSKETTYTKPKPLPEGWREKLDAETGTLYYWHVRSRKASWARPGDADFGSELLGSTDALLGAASDEPPAPPPRPPSASAPAPAAEGVGSKMIRVLSFGRRGSAAKRPASAAASSASSSAAASSSSASARPSVGLSVSELPKKKLDIKDFMFTKRKGEVLVKPPGSINGQQFIVEECEDCDIFLLDWSAMVTVDLCKRCRLVIGPCESSVFLRDCEELKCVIACQQLRTREVKGLDALLMTVAQPSIEETRHARFGCYNLQYEALAAQFTAAKLSPYNNRWAEPYNFTKHCGDPTLLPTDTPYTDLVQPLSRHCAQAISEAAEGLVDGAVPRAAVARDLFCGGRCPVPCTVGAHAAGAADHHGFVVLLPRVTADAAATAALARELLGGGGGGLRLIRAKRYDRTSAEMLQRLFAQSGGKEAKKLAADAIKGAVVGLHVTADGGACVAELGALAKRVNGGEKAAAAYAAASAAEVSHMCAVYFEAKDTGTEMGP